MCSTNTLLLNTFAILIKCLSKKKNDLFLSASFSSPLFLLSVSFFTRFHSHVNINLLWNHQGMCLLT